MIIFDVQQEELRGGQRLSGRWLECLARGVDQELGKSFQGVVSVAFISTPRMRALTKEYRGDDHVSDILTFPLLERCKWKKEEIVGEILLCYSQIAKQAKEKKSNLKNEIAFLLAHGVLHLQGRTHPTDRKLAQMIISQKAILARAGIFYPL